MLRTIEGNPYGILGVTFSANGKDVLSVSQLDNITVNISDATTGQLKRTLDNKMTLGASWTCYTVLFGVNGKTNSVARSGHAIAI
jgi:WD40 repeat protein